MSGRKAHKPHVIHAHKINNNNTFKVCYHKAFVHYIYIYILNLLQAQNTKRKKEIKQKLHLH